MRSRNATVIAPRTPPPSSARMRLGPGPNRCQSRAQSKAGLFVTGGPSKRLLAWRRPALDLTLVVAQIPSHFGVPPAFVFRRAGTGYGPIEGRARLDDRLTAGQRLRGQAIAE